MSNGIGKNPLIDISKVYVQQVVEKKKDDTYLEPDMKKRQANNEKARKELAKGPQMKNPHFESVEKSGWDAIKACADGYAAVYKEAVKGQDSEMRKAASAERKSGYKRLSPSAGKGYADQQKQSISYMDKKTKNNKIVVGMTHEALDPVGKEDGDVNNDGKKDSSDKYLMKRRKAIATAMASTKKKMTEGVRDLDPEKGTAERKARLEKKRGMKLDDHPQYKKVEEGMHRDAKTGEVVDKAEVGKTYYPNMPKRKTSVALRKEKMKESFSSWRNDLSEVMTDDDISDKPIKEKKVRNTIKINPKLGEAIEAMGGELIEATEVDEAVYGGAPMKEEAAMSDKEIRLQKQKARIDQMIAQRRKQDLSKKSEAPTKAMGEEVVSERTRFAKETGKDFKTGNPSEKGGTRTGTSAFDKVSREMRKTGGVMSSRGKAIQPQGKKKEPGKKGYKGVTPVDKIKKRLAQKRAAKPNPYRARAGESD